MMPAVIAEAREKLETLRKQHLASPNSAKPKMEMLHGRTFDRRTINDTAKKMKIDVCYLVLDSLLSQLNDRFSDSSLAIVKLMSHFSHGEIMKIIHQLET
ncbi:hypothetical protein PR048_031205 [Dryococelus australis]|uniref:Uncharacterized protein n=1 Tax=Dryococelus australis TaxID=614101 RepID=A0ABQ9G8P2_9NEOP|nr:hypothetical protein PR048_031205 [Dryococelus australis]